MNPNTDRDERVDRLIEHLKSNPVVCVCKPFCVHWEVHAKKVLTPLLDSQAAEKAYAERTPIGIQIANDAATAMRDRCVAKVREIAADYDNPRHPNTGAAISKQALMYAARQLQSLTLDQVEQEK